MEPYKNLGGNSGISAFENGVDYIKVQFTDRKVYLYNNRRPGIKHVDQMKELAIKGKGLNSYINKYVRKNYASKLR